MRIIGIEGMSTREINEELTRGGKFVSYQYCISLLFVTFKRNSDIYFVRSYEKAAAKGLGFTALSLLMGWWGIPWGPIHTISCITTNFNGGKNVTSEVLSTSRATTVSASPRVSLG